MFFSNTCHAISAGSKLDPGFQTSFHQQNAVFSEHGQKQTIFFENDLFNDDDDENSSVKKKIPFIYITGCENNKKTLNAIANSLHKWNFRPDVSLLSFPDIISLRVLRL